MYTDKYCVIFNHFEILKNSILLGVEVSSSKIQYVTNVLFDRNNLGTFEPTTTFTTTTTTIITTTLT